MKGKKILLLTIPVMALGLGLGLSLKPNVSAVRAEEVVAVQEEEESESKIENFKNTYLVPLLSGVSITAVLSFASSVIIAFINSKVNKKTRKEVFECVAQVVSLFALFNEIYKKMSESEKIAEEINDKIEEFSKLFDEQIKALYESATKTEELKKIVVTLCEIQKELAKVDSKLVSSGVAKKIVEITAQVKKLEE